MTIAVEKVDNEETKEATEEVKVKQPNNYDIDSYIE